MSAPRWVSIGGGAALYLAPVGRRFAAECARLAQAEGVRLDDAHLEQHEAIQADALSRLVLLDWRGVSVDGQPDAPYTVERGRTALLNSPRFKEIVMAGAEVQEDFNRALIEQTCEVLKWNLRWGPAIDGLYLHKARFGETPKALKERPEMTPDQRSYLDSFHVLSKFRGGSGFGPNPLQYSDVVDFAIHLGYAPGSEGLLFFLEMMAALDADYLKIMEEKRPKTPPKAQPRQPRRRT